MYLLSQICFSVFKNSQVMSQTVHSTVLEEDSCHLACRSSHNDPCNIFTCVFIQIHSDCAANQPVTYRISGVGIDQPPYGIFIINQKTGEINITSIVDHEVTPFFIVSGLYVNIYMQIEIILGKIIDHTRFDFKSLNTGPSEIFLNSLPQQMRKYQQRNVSLMCQQKSQFISAP